MLSRLPKIRRRKLVKLKSLLDGGLISQEDFDKAKAEVLKQLIG